MICHKSHFSPSRHLLRASFSRCYFVEEKAKRRTNGRTDRWTNASFRVIKVEARADYERNTSHLVVSEVAREVEEGERTGIGVEEKEGGGGDPLSMHG